MADSFFLELMSTIVATITAAYTLQTFLPAFPYCNSQKLLEGIIL